MTASNDFLKYLAVIYTNVKKKPYAVLRVYVIFMVLGINTDKMFCIVMYSVLENI